MDQRPLPALRALDQHLRHTCFQPSRRELQRHLATCQEDGQAISHLLAPPGLRRTPHLMGLRPFLHLLASFHGQLRHTELACHSQLQHRRQCLLVREPQDHQCGRINCLCLHQLVVLDQLRGLDPLAGLDQLVRLDQLERREDLRHLPATWLNGRLPGMLAIRPAGCLQVLVQHQPPRW